MRLIIAVARKFIELRLHSIRISTKEIISLSGQGSFDSWRWIAQWFDTRNTVNCFREGGNCCILINEIHRGKSRKRTRDGLRCKEVVERGKSFRVIYLEPCCRLCCLFMEIKASFKIEWILSGCEDKLKLREDQFLCFFPLSSRSN